MLGHAAAEGAKVVAAFQAGHDAAFALRLGKVHQLAGDPGVVGFHQAHLTHIVFAVGVEAGADEQHLRRESPQSGEPLLGDNVAYPVALGVGRDGDVDHIRLLAFRTAVGVEGVLEEAHHQHPFIAAENVFGAVAVVHIEIDDGHAIQPAHIERMACGNGDIAEKTESHGLIASGMMAGRADGAKGVVQMTVDDGIGRADGRTGGPQRGLPGMRIHHRVRVDPLMSLLEITALFEIGDIQRRVRALNVLQAGGRRVVVALEPGCNLRGDQPVFNGGEALRAFGMVCPHFVQSAVGMGVEAGRHGSCLLRHIPRFGGMHVVLVA